MFLSIYTPEKPVLVRKEVASVIIPAYEGQMGILPGHLKVVAQLVSGALRFKNLDGTEEKFAVFGGFAEFLGEELEVFAEDAALAGQLSAEEAKQKAAAAKAALTKKEADLDLALAEIEIKKQILLLKKKK